MSSRWLSIMSSLLSYPFFLPLESACMLLTLRPFIPKVFCVLLHHPGQTQAQLFGVQLRVTHRVAKRLLIVKELHTGLLILIRPRHLFVPNFLWQRDTYEVQVLSSWVHTFWHDLACVEGHGPFGIGGTLGVRCLGRLGVAALVLTLRRFCAWFE
jgi:hypothetical protein